MALKSVLKLNLFPSFDRKVLRKQVGSYIRIHGSTNGNTNIPAGQVFDIDLMQAPFTLDAPLLAYNELTCVRRSLLNLPLGFFPWNAAVLQPERSAADLQIAHVSCLHAIAAAINLMGLSQTLTSPYLVFIRPRHPLNTVWGSKARHAHVNRNLWRGLMGSAPSVTCC